MARSDSQEQILDATIGTAKPIYRWADPLGRNPYGVMDPGPASAAP